MQELDLIIDKLRKHPLFYISQASKELFHSNFWAWLAEKNTSETIKIFSAKEYHDSYEFKREYNQSFKTNIKGEKRNLKSKNDFVLFEKKEKNPKPIMVIENKVKDFPSEGQLNRIRESFNDNELEYVLVTLYWVEGIKFQGWENIKRYLDISNRIHPEKFTAEPFELELIKKYVEFCEILHSLSNILPITENYDFTYSFNRALLEKLNAVKLAEGYLKMRSTHFLSKYKKPYEFITTENSINNQKATISFSYPLKEDYKAGVQLEDNQFRWFVQGKKHQEFAENLIALPLFFDTKPSPRGLRYLNYKPDFKYQYRILQSERPFNDIFREINEKLSFIHHNKVDIESQIP